MNKNKTNKTNKNNKDNSSTDEALAIIRAKTKTPKPPKGKVKFIRMAEVPPDRRIILPSVLFRFAPELENGRLVIGIFADEQGRQLIIKPCGRHVEEEIL